MMWLRENKVLCFENYVVYRYRCCFSLVGGFFHNFAIVPSPSPRHGQQFHALANSIVHRTNACEAANTIMYHVKRIVIHQVKFVTPGTNPTF